MTDRRNPSVSARKTPRQARATALIAAVLDAAVQVLRTEGAARFTTARVAERAGVSVGSLYQYFPNKAAILFRLQADEWRRTTDMLCAILKDAHVPPPDRLRQLVHAFLLSECEEAQVRVALGDAAPLYRNTPEAGDARADGSRVILAFVSEALPDVNVTRRILAARLIEDTMTQVGSSFSQVERSAAEIAAYADAMADMFVAYLGVLTAEAGAWDDLAKRTG